MKKALLNANDYAVYFYDSTGQRARKVVKKGANVEERRYVAGWEVWRKTVSGTLDEERTTLHVMDDQRRVAMIETKTVSGGSTVGTPVPRVRYQLDNHLGTAILELSDTAGIISYEEYHPYGTCAWWAGDSSIDVSRRRYRYTGMERDDETGLQYHSARYYAAWLGRWGSADPIGLEGGLNVFAYGHGNPGSTVDHRGTEPMSAEQAFQAEIDRLETAEIPIGWVSEAFEENYVFMGSANRTYFAFDYPNEVDLPIMQLNKTVPSVSHESVHDYMLRHKNEPGIRALKLSAIADVKYKRTTTGHIVLSGDAPVLADEALATFVQGQIEARLSTKVAVEAVDAFVSGDLSEEDLGRLLGASREITETYLHHRGTVEGLGTLKADLSAESKRGAADVFLGGVYYEHWEDLPDVQRALARAEAYCGVQKLWRESCGNSGGWSRG